MNPELEETIYCDFVTSSPTTGAAIDADSTPTCEVFEDATDTAILSPTVVKRTGKTGNYRIPVACTAANGFEAAKSYNVVVSATVGAVAAKAIVQTFQMRTNGADDLAASILTRAAPGAAMILTAAYDLAKTAAQAGNAMTLTAAYDPAKLAAPVGAAMTLTAAYDPAKLAAPVGAAMTLTAAYDAAKTASTQASVNTLTTYVDTEVAAIKVQTDQLVFAAGKVNANVTIVASDLIAIADAILKRDWTAISGEAAFSLLNAARLLRNVWDASTGTLIVKAENGTTTVWTRPITTNAAAIPITGVT